MVAFNPNFPEVLGLEWLANFDQKSRVWAGAPARMLRLRSTTAETIASLKLSATVDPLSEASVPTLVDVIEEGNEFVALPKITRLVPNSDKLNEGWTRSDAASTNLYQYIDDDTTRWPNPGSTAETQWIRTFTPTTAYACSVNAALFDTGGAAQNGRIFWVGVGAILSANTGLRKLGAALRIGGTLYPPAAGGVRDVSVFGALYSFWWGELNPSTGRPWTPADIAAFGSAGTSDIYIRSQTAATSTHYPRVHALSLNVHYADTENRVAVGVWRRPNDIGTARLLNVTTDTLRTVPSGAANWSKAASKSYLFYWRQTVSPSEYGPVVADDVRWNGLYQDLGPGGQPAGVVYPLHSSGTAPPPTDKIASRGNTYDQYGRPQVAFDATSRAGYGLVMVTDAAATSTDSQPYRLDVADLVTFRSGSGILAQRVTPASTQNYLGVRLPIIPPDDPGAATLTVTVHRVSDGVQMGGSFSITAAAVRALPQATSGWRYVTGFLSSAASLVGGTQYEVRLASDGGGVGGDYTAAAPDCSLGNTASFGGSTSGAVIAGTHQTSRDLCVNLIRQPDPPTGLTAAITNVAVTTYVSSQVSTVQHVNISWTAPAVGMGAVFSRYELERQLDSGTWQRVANVNNAATTSFVDHEVPRSTAATYRIRAVGTDGRISQWATSGSVTPTAPGLILIFTSNHDLTRELVYFFDRESTYPVLSNERDETVMIHGSDRQVVFMETENRGIGWRTNVVINQVTLTGKGGQHVLTPLLNLIRSQSVPYVCVLDDRGTGLMGHVSVSEASRRQPQHRYAAEINVIPTHDEPIPAEVS